MGNAAAKAAPGAAGERAGFLEELRGHFPRVLGCAESRDPETARFTAMIFAEEVAKPEHRVAIVELGGVRLLAPFSESPDPFVQELAAQSMACLSSEERNQIPMTQGGCAALLVHLLASPCDATQRHAALGLANLALKEANREAIAAAGAVALLIELTSRGATTQARAEAVAALANLAMDGATEVTITSKGALQPILDAARSGSPELECQAVRALRNLAGNAENRALILSLGGSTDTLLGITRASENKRLRDQAAHALVNLGAVPAPAARGPAPLLACCAEEPDELSVAIAMPRGARRSSAEGLPAAAGGAGASVPPATPSSRRAWWRPRSAAVMPLTPSSPRRPAGASETPRRPGSATVIPVPPLFGRASPASSAVAPSRTRTPPAPFLDADDDGLRGPSPTARRLQLDASDPMLVPAEQVGHPFQSPDDAVAGAFADFGGESAPPHALTVASPSGSGGGSKDTVTLSPRHELQSPAARGRAGAASFSVARGRTGGPAAADSRSPVSARGPLSTKASRSPAPPARTRATFFSEQAVAAERKQVPVRPRREAPSDSKSASPAPTPRTGGNSARVGAAPTGPSPRSEAKSQSPAPPGTVRSPRAGDDKSHSPRPAASVPRQQQRQQGVGAAPKPTPSARQRSDSVSKPTPSASAAKLTPSGSAARLAASGSTAKLTPSGSTAKLTPSGSASRLAASSSTAKLTPSGSVSKLPPGETPPPLLSSVSGPELDDGLVSDILLPGMPAASKFDGVQVTSPKRDVAGRLSGLGSVGRQSALGLGRHSGLSSTVRVGGNG